MQIKTAHHRNRALLLENERPTKELDELKKQLDKEEKENDYALIKTHNYREELVDACQAKEKEESQAKDVEKQIKAVKKRIKEKFEPIIINYNTNIIKSTNLYWLDNDYPKALVLAWEQILKERESLGGGVVDLKELEQELLSANKIGALRIGELILHLDLAVGAQKDQGESSESAIQDATTSLNFGLPSASISPLDL